MKNRKEGVLELLLTYTFKYPQIPLLYMPIQKVCNEFGVEIETITAIDKRIPRLITFRTTDDGSLSGGGIEFVSEKIAFSDKEKVKEFKKEIKKISKVSTPDVSCGLHIHLNCPITRLMQRQKLKKLILGYRLFEPIIFSMVSKSRRSNRFAKKLSTHEAFSDLDRFVRSDFYNILGNYFGFRLIDMPKGEKRLPVKENLGHQNKGAFDRYLYLNLQSIFYHGSIEIRLHQGTTDAEKIWNWLQLHRKFILHLLGMNIADIMKLYEKEGQEAFWKIVKNKKLEAYYKARIEGFGKMRDTSKNVNLEIFNAYLKKQEKLDNEKLNEAIDKDMEENPITDETDEEIESRLREVEQEEIEGHDAEELRARRYRTNADEDE